MQQATLGQSLRDEGVHVTLHNAGHDWHERAVEIALEVFTEAGSDGAIFEDVRERAAQRGIGLPPSPNAWGAVCLSMSKRELIIRTGGWRPSKIASNHARAAAVWRLATEVAA
jgi:hypothetical protein